MTADRHKIIWKELGETPLQALERLREQEGIGVDVPMTYAGRLDPLAEGELLVLIGEECKKKDEYLRLDKEYEVEVLLGVQTDTGDVMGIVDTTTKQGLDAPTARSNLAVEEIEGALSEFVGKIAWPYPVFSSKTVRGKPLFLWALEGKLNEVEIPIRESEIYELELLSIPSVKLGVSELRNVVHQKINSVRPVSENVESKRLGEDFRREDVLANWASFFTSAKEQQVTEFKIIKVRCKCSSGTYMRTLAQKAGEELGTSALALSIVRTNIFIDF